MRNYYLILGVGPNETSQGIRSAYRELAKKYHPDHAGERSRRRFQEIQEAYETLSDPEKRRVHNRDLAEAERRGALRRGRRAEPWVAEPLSAVDPPESIRHSFDVLLETILANITGAGIGKGKRVEGLNVEVVLTHEEALNGVVLPVAVPTFGFCPFCNGTGIEWVFPCRHCRGAGVANKEETVYVRIPAMVVPGTILEIPLSGLGIRNFCLRVHVFVD